MSPALHPSPFFYRTPTATPKPMMMGPSRWGRWFVSHPPIPITDLLLCNFFPTLLVLYDYWCHWNKLKLRRRPRSLWEEKYFTMKDGESTQWRMANLQTPKCVCMCVRARIWFTFHISVSYMKTIVMSLSKYWNKGLLARNRGENQRL